MGVFRQPSFVPWITLQPRRPAGLATPTRLYFAHSAAAVTPVVGGNGTYTFEADAYLGLLATSKTNTALFTLTADGNASTFDSFLAFTAVSSPIAAQTIGGAGWIATGQVRAGDTAISGSTMLVGVELYVVSNDGSTLRGNLGLLFGDAITSSFLSPTDLLNSRLTSNTGGALNSVVCSAGDRIVAKIIVQVNSGLAAESIDFRFGDPSATGDLPEDNTTITDLDPWIEFSQAISFQTFSTQNPSGAITPAGALAKQVNKTLAGATTPAGTLSLRISRALAGSTTPAGAIVKQINKPLAGQTTPTGAVAKQINKPLAGATTPAGAISKQVNKALAGATAPASAITKLVNKALSGTITPSGSAAKLLARALAGETTLGGAVFKQANKPLAGATTPAGVISKQTNKALTGAVTPAATITQLINKLLAGATTPTGAATKQISRPLSGATTPTGALVKQLARALAGAASPSGAIAKQPNKALAGATTPAGAISKQANKALAGEATPSSAITKLLSRSLSGSMSPAGADANATLYPQALSGSISPSGALTNTVIPAGDYTPYDPLGMMGIFGI